MKPLTLEEIDKLYKESKYVGLGVILEIYGIKCYGVIDKNNTDGILGVFSSSGICLKQKDYGKTWLAYIE